MSGSVDLNKLSHLQLQELAAALLNQLSEKDCIIQSKDQEIQFRQAKIDKLTHEIAVLRRIKFAASSERLANEQQRSHNRRCNHVPGPRQRGDLGTAAPNPLKIFH